MFNKTRPLEWFTAQINMNYMLIFELSYIFVFCWNSNSLFRYSVDDTVRSGKPGKEITKLV